MTELNYKAMYEAARDEAERLRGQLRKTEGELTAERLAAEQARGRDPWHVLTGGRKAEGFALSCDCPGCKETRRLAGVRLLQQKIHDAEAVARNSAPAEKEATRAALAANADLTRRVSELSARVLAYDVREKKLEAEVERQRGRADAGNARANEALRAAERAIERTQRARGRARKREAAAARALELAPYVRAFARAGKSGLEAVLHARAAVDSMRVGS